jgi:hypothetical protein
MDEAWNGCGGTDFCVDAVWFEARPEEVPRQAQHAVH